MEIRDMLKLFTVISVVYVSQGQATMTMKSPVGNMGMQHDWMNTCNTILAKLYHTDKAIHQGSNTLFEQYPLLKERISYVSLATLPTPVEKLQKISELCGVDIYIKMDDRAGGVDAVGGAMYGGNKVRKLEFLLADALRLGAHTIMTFGCVGSNHAIATAVYARKLGMDTLCMLMPQPRSEVVTQNLLMHLVYKSQLHLSADSQSRALHAILVWLNRYKNELQGLDQVTDNQIPYIIPTGGSNVLGTIGFVNAVFELREQIKQGLLPEPSHIYVACGSGATAVGILLGVKATGLRSQVVAVLVEPDVQAELGKHIERLFKETNSYLRTLDSSFPDCVYTDEDLKIIPHFSGLGYGMATKESIEARALLQMIENIQLEDTYTGKAFAALVDDVIKEERRVILFWNTFNSRDNSPDIQGIDYHALPSCFHEYFDESK